MPPVLDPLLFLRKPKPPPLPAPEPPSLDYLSPAISTQSEKAVNALVAHLHNEKQKQGNKEKAKGKESDNLLESGNEGEDDWLSLVITLKALSGREKHKPIRISLPYPLYMPPKRHSVCLFVKDPQRTYKDLLAEKNIGFISRVVGVNKLKGKFKPYEARRMLMKDHDLFLADDRVVELMPKLLGKSWVSSNKSPIPVRIKQEGLKAELERAISATYLYISRGTCVSLRFGSPTHHTPAQLLSNLTTIIPHLAVRLPPLPGSSSLPSSISSWSNVQALHIKSKNSISLPIWTCGISEETPGGRFYVPEEVREREEERSAKKQRLDESGKSKDKKTKVKAIEPAPAESTTPEKLLLEATPTMATTPPSGKKKKRKHAEVTVENSGSQPAPEPVAAPTKKRKDKKSKSKSSSTEKPKSKAKQKV